MKDGEEREEFDYSSCSLETLLEFFVSHYGYLFEWLFYIFFQATYIHLLIVKTEVRKDRQEKLFLIHTLVLRPQKKLLLV